MFVFDIMFVFDMHVFDKNSRHLSPRQIRAKLYVSDKNIFADDDAWSSGLELLEEQTVTYAAGEGSHSVGYLVVI